MTKVPKQIITNILRSYKKEKNISFDNNYKIQIIF